jgi:RHS repeat-associated protein
VELETSADNADITNTYDPNTGSLTDSTLENSAVSSTPFNNTSYAYDPSGNVTSETDTRSTTADGTQSEQQCYDYTPEDQLAQAWTSASTATSACSAVPSTGSGGTVGDGISGSAYWTQWQYNPLGDQATETDNPPAGGTATVTSYTYNNGNGTTGGQPNTLTSSTTTGGTTGSSAETYDADGNTTSQSVTAGGSTQDECYDYTPGGQLSQAWPSAGLPCATTAPAASATSYVYDTDGDLLAADNPGSDTVYVFGEQITATTSGGTTTGITGLRFIPLPGGAQAVRAGTGANYYFETADLKNTSVIAINSSLEDPVWRQFTPYGAPRSTATGTWPDTNGYLGDPVNGSDDLTTIGERQYDPTTGRFLTPDPVLEAGDPTQMGGYAYAADNPVTDSDPSGQIAVGPSNSDCSTGTEYLPQCGGHGASGTGTGGGTGGTASTGPVPINHPGVVNPGNSHLPVAAFDAATASMWLGSLNALNDYLGAEGPIANKYFTLLLSEVEVQETPDGPPVLRLVAFANSNGLPDDLENALTEQGVQIYEADPFERHAEIAAQNFRADPEAQQDVLGGTITRVNSAVMNNGACSSECADGLTSYIGREDVTVQVGGRGVLGDEVLNPAEMASLRNEFGGVSNVEAMIQASPTAADATEGDVEGYEP